MEDERRFWIERDTGTGYDNVDRTALGREIDVSLGMGLQFTVGTMPRKRPQTPPLTLEDADQCVRSARIEGEIRDIDRRLTLIEGANMGEWRFKVDGDIHVLHDRVAKAWSLLSKLEQRSDKALEWFNEIYTKLDGTKSTL